MTLSDIDPPNGYRISGEGQGGAAGFAKGGAVVTLREDGGDTLLNYNVDAQVGGKIAQVGARLIDGTAKKLADEFFGKFADHGRRPAAGRGGRRDAVGCAARARHGFAAVTAARCSAARLSALAGHRRRRSRSDPDFPCEPLAAAAVGRGQSAVIRNSLDRRMSGLRESAQTPCGRALARLRRNQQCEGDDYMTIPVAMTVNGKAVSGKVEARTLLVQFLREQLGLTGTHVGCDTSQCGACIVHVDGKSVKSCTMLAVQAEGAKVLTIEGLAESAEKLHPMQEAFRENHGLQCGFCTPGMVMSAIDMVKRHNYQLDEATVRRELEGNLCRCTGYHNIVKAILAAAPAMKSAGV